MGFLLFRRKKSRIDDKLSEIHDSLRNSFSKIKGDILSLDIDLQKLDKHKENHSQLVENLDSRLKKIENIIDNVLNDYTVVQTDDLSKQRQTNVRPKQTSVPVQTEILESLKRLTPMERSLVWALLNTDLKLSYSDLARILGKDESTVRGQVSNIKRKTDGLILEKSENNGQKRFYIGERVKNRIMKKYKIKNKKNS